MIILKDFIFAHPIVPLVLLPYVGALLWVFR